MEVCFCLVMREPDIVSSRYSVPLVYDGLNIRQFENFLANYPVFPQNSGKSITHSRYQETFLTTATEHVSMVTLHLGIHRMRSCSVQYTVH
jgi:hypothetical protein